MALIIIIAILIICSVIAYAISKGDLKEYYNTRHITKGYTWKDELLSLIISIFGPAGLLFVVILSYLKHGKINLCFRMPQNLKHGYVKQSD